jgi:hypothetical protein
MGRLIKLKTLKAPDNQLTSIPQEFRDLKNLQVSVLCVLLV